MSHLVWKDLLLAVALSAELFCAKSGGWHERRLAIKRVLTRTAQFARLPHRLEAIS